ncbi:UDP-N-acetylmuramoyl-tripeptide--D-alanyl-D-alanine ligase [Salininema proteolyticum]|uniref:UDP-N-acetylmuramoyl-tripeptide--D-alanyl-D-alanine ligase n=1 Tax=Salininema proteolyticum TaxID=1607685 RepID=A0ABV8TVK3_9ACTN
MIPMTLAEVASVTGGRLSDAALADVVVDGAVEHDSRRVGAGDLFLALEGERVDGHRFAEDVSAKGAVATLATKEVPTAAIYVDDGIEALTKLASATARRTDAAIVGVTGSNGKTSTKDLIAAVCETAGPTVATRGNFNNELGHPYTVCQVRPETRYLVLEISARGIGHIRHLTEIAPPSIGAVLNVGISHLDGFGSIEKTAEAKSELPAALPETGTAVLNADDPRVAAMADVTDARVLTFGRGEEPSIAAEDVDPRDGRHAFTLRAPDGSARVELEVWGAHQVSNALAAAGVAHALGIPAEQTARALSGAPRRSERRMDVFTNPAGIAVIDDSYNANPASMAGAVRSLAALPAEGRRFAVLGLMADLEELSEDEHRKIGALAVELSIDRVIAVGEGTEPLAGAAGERARHVATQDEAVAILAEEARPGDAVLAKGSRYRTWEVADFLRAQTEAPAGYPAEDSQEEKIQ